MMISAVGQINMSKNIEVVLTLSSRFPGDRHNS